MATDCATVFMVGLTVISGSKSRGKLMPSHWGGYIEREREREQVEKKLNFLFKVSDKKMLFAFTKTSLYEK